MNVDHIGEYAPFITIFGPIVGAIIGALVTYFVVVKRKKLVFWIGETEEITEPVRREHERIKFKIGDIEVDNLNRAVIEVRNRGNGLIGNLDFEIEFEGPSEYAIVAASAKNQRLQQAIQIQKIEQAIPVSTSFNVKLPFLNPHEEFELVVLFDGEKRECKVHCRIEDVNIRMRRGSPLASMEIFGLKVSAREAEAVFGVTGAMGAFLAAIASWIVAATH